MNELRTEVVTLCFLQPGEILVAETPSLVKTILGSCVAITMRAPRIDLAAVAHCLLPNAGAPADSLPRSEALRYVDATIEIMLRVFAQRGAARPELEVKVFGGADNLANSGRVAAYGVGSRNSETALGLLAALGIIPASIDIGGRCGRVIEFQTETGHVFVKRLPEAFRAGYLEGR